LQDALCETAYQAEVAALSFEVRRGQMSALTSSERKDRRGCLPSTLHSSHVARPKAFRGCPAFGHVPCSPVLQVAPEGAAGVSLRLDGFSHKLPALAEAVFTTLAGLQVPAQGLHAARSLRSCLGPLMSASA
jgi:hypothetical protein